MITFKFNLEKKQMIEEMAKDLHKTHAVSAMCDGKDCNHCKHADLRRFKDYTCIDLDLAEALYNAGYRKIPENTKARRGDLRKNKKGDIKL